MREKGVLYCFDSLHSFRHLQSLAALQDGLCHQHQAWPKPHGTKWDAVDRTNPVCPTLQLSDGIQSVAL